MRLFLLQHEEKDTMGRAISTGRSRREVAAYAADMLASLKRISSANGLDLLAHLMDLARVEAIRNRLDDQSPDRPKDDRET